MMLYESLLYLLFWLLNFCFFFGCLHFLEVFALLFLSACIHVLAYFFTAFFFCFFGSWFVQIFKLIGSLHIAKVDWLKLLPILVLCGGESQKPGNFKERTTYTLLYFHKKRYNLRDSIFCLLYTSPSPRDKRQSRMPSSA